MTSPLAYLLVMVEDGAVAFCHYENPRFHSPGKPHWISEELLGGLIQYAQAAPVALTFLFGKSRPPARLARLLRRAGHAAIVPLALRDDFPGAVLVLDSEDGEAFADLSPDPARNVILRLPRRDLGRCGELCASLAGRYGRLAIHLREIEYFTGADVATYAGELKKVSDGLVRLYREGHRVEVNALTDRMMLRAMRNCDAGVRHLTVAPDGDCYICPAFVHGGAPIGRFDVSAGITAEPPGGLELARGPLCTRCDAYQCKRCVYLSRRLTQEYNVPSEQQCALAHAEREATRLLLKELGGIEPFRRMPRIAELNYRDPLEMIGVPPPGICSP